MTRVTEKTAFYEGEIDPIVITDQAWQDIDAAGKLSTNASQRAVAVKVLEAFKLALMVERDGAPIADVRARLETLQKSRSEERRVGKEC